MSAKSQKSTTMKLSAIVEIAPHLAALAATKLPAKAGFRIAENLNLVKPKMRHYDAERTKLADSLATKSADGTRYEFNQDNGKQFVDQMAALGDEDVEIKFLTIAPADLGDVAIEPQHLAALMGVVIKEA